MGCQRTGMSCIPVSHCGGSAVRAILHLCFATQQPPSSSSRSSYGSASRLPLLSMLPGSSLSHCGSDAGVAARAICHCYHCRSSQFSQWMADAAPRHCSLCTRSMLTVRHSSTASQRRRLQQQPSRRSAIMLSAHHQPRLKPAELQPKPSCRCLSSSNIRLSAQQLPRQDIRRRSTTQLPRFHLYLCGHRSLSGMPSLLCMLSCSQHVLDRLHRAGRLL